MRPLFGCAGQRTLGAVASVTAGVSEYAGSVKMNELGAGAHKHGQQPDAMAPITSECDAMRCPSIKWP